MVYKRTTSKIGKIKITNTQNSNGSRTYSQSTGQKFKGGSSTRSTVSTKSNRKRTLTYTTTSPGGWVNKRVTVLNKPISTPKVKKYKAPKSSPIKNTVRRTRRSKVYKSQPITMGQVKVLSVIFLVLCLIALFTH
jgi:hypothetical protein